MTSFDYYITNFVMLLAGVGIGICIGDIIKQAADRKNHGLTPKERFIKK